MIMTDAIETTDSVIQEAIARLRQLTQADIQPQWRYGVSVDPTTWTEIAPLNDRHHIAWEKGQQELWLGQLIEIPSHLHLYPLAGFTLRLALTWWADLAQIYVHGRLVQEGDLFDCSARIVLTEAATPGDRIAVAIRLISPGHDNGALVRSRLIYENPDGSLNPTPEPGFVADELAVLACYVRAFQPEALVKVHETIQTIDWTALPDRHQFDASLAAVRQTLMSYSAWLKQRCLHPVGHAHLDLAWLWPIAETWVAAERTFQSVLHLQQEFPELTFTHSTPALYAWMEEHRPDLFAAIQRQVQAGVWHVDAGLWVEPDLNLIGGESLVRQVLYGQRYVKERFGDYSAIAWLPDTFGFCWQFPQILRLGGVSCFATQKLRWNDTNPFPHELFEWRSPDGTSILGLTLPPIGESIDPLKMATYAVAWEENTGFSQALWLPGVGDHGGGPTRDMLELARRWQTSPFFPRLEWSNPEDFLRQLQRQKLPSDRSLMAAPSAPLDFSAHDLPGWCDELYLELHRGCYTTHADQKQRNRRCEVLLYDAEVFGAIATFLLKVAYPHQDLELAWKQVLFNQFHDILPGSSIPEVYVEADELWQVAETTGQQVLQNALGAIAQQIQIPAAPHPDCQPVVVWNSLTWRRSAVVSIAVPTGTSWLAYDGDGNGLPSQQDGETGDLLVAIADLPAVGYQLIWIRPHPPSDLLPAPLEGWVLENDCLRVVVNSTTGELDSVFDKQHQREVLSAAGNQLHAFVDQGQYWDAWNIDPNYEQHPLPPPVLQSMQWIETGSVRQRLRVVRSLRQSTFVQDYVLEWRSPLLKIQTQVDWQERHVVVKAAFPLAVTADHATYDMPFGAIARPTNPTDPRDKAKWEVPALHWADLTEQAETPYGASLLSDCKYGYDSRPSQLRLTLLKGAVWPDPTADRGRHDFTYALYPHGDTWQAADVIQRGDELTHPVHATKVNGSSPSASGTLPSRLEFLHLEASNLRLSALKRAEDHPTQWIVRLYEAHGTTATVDLSNLGVFSTQIRPQSARLTNLLEEVRPTEMETFSTLQVQPWQVVTLKFTHRDA
jgi:alpha-mannosidase